MCSISRRNVLRTVLRALPGHHHHHHLDDPHHPVGLIVANATLIAKVVRRHHVGRYKCAAANAEGKAESRELQLDVLRKFVDVRELLYICTFRAASVRARGAIISAPRARQMRGALSRRAPRPCVRMY